jgi:predicted nucleic acid-binding protein
LRRVVAIKQLKKLVLDASVAIAWCFEDEATPETEGILDLLGKGTTVVVPAVWPLEVANAMLSAERKKRMTVAQATAFLARIAGFPISIDAMPLGRAFDQVLSVGRQHRLTAYDAAYLELALRETLPLATLDADLRRSAESAGVALV